jgi:uncharacterized LabA/DUF88 family protein
MYPDARVAILVDAQNIYHSAKNLYQSRVNFAELKRTLLGGRSCIRAYTYVVKGEGIGEKSNTISEDKTGEGSFFEAMKNAGFELRLKDLQVYAGGFKKADWDVGIAIDAVRLASSVDVIVLVTGDGDFVPLVEYLTVGLGKQVEVAAFSRTTSSKLRDIAHQFTELESVPKMLLPIKNTKQRRPTRFQTKRGNNKNKK